MNTNFHNLQMKSELRDSWNETLANQHVNKTTMHPCSIGFLYKNGACCVQDAEREEKGGQEGALSSFENLAVQPRRLDMNAGKRSLACVEHASLLLADSSVQGTLISQ